MRERLHLYVCLVQPCVCLIISGCNPCAGMARRGGPDPDPNPKPNPNPNLNPNPNPNLDQVWGAEADAEEALRVARSVPASMGALGLDVPARTLDLVLRAHTAGWFEVRDRVLWRYFTMEILSMTMLTVEMLTMAMLTVEMLTVAMLTMAILTVAGARRGARRSIGRAPALTLHRARAHRRSRRLQPHAPVGGRRAAPGASQAATAADGGAATPDSNTSPDPNPNPNLNPSS